MGTLLLNQIKKQASVFIQEKYKTARIAFTDVTEAELLAEEATNNDPWGPEARTMTRIAVASFDVDDYWRIVDVLHKRFNNVDWKDWRQLYKALVLLEFLLTHGPEDLAEEFRYDIDVIRELGTFQFIDDKGFDWGGHMQKRSDDVQNLLGGGENLKMARLKALKITKEIKGFGGPITSPSSPSSSTSSFDSFSTSSSEKDVTCNNLFSNEKSNLEFDSDNEEVDIQRSSLLESDCDELNRDGLVSGICSKLVSISPLKKCEADKKGFRSISSNVARVSKTHYDRQYSMGY